MTVENFKCYRRDVPTLHLQGVHIACLCGPNGHGKSSLLDAMAWALWGEAMHRPQEELVHVGEQDMRVELEFVAGGPSTGSARGQRYRAIRRYTRGRGARAGATSLELQVASSTESRLATFDQSSELSEGEEDATAQFRSISGDSVRQTEAAILKLVGMDYDTFVNSAYLLQGRADEFTNKRPAERQHVLGNILGLGFYDRLQERARQRVRDGTSEIQRIQGEVQAWAQELARRPEHEEELPQVETDLKLARSQLTAAEQEVTTLREQVERLRSRQRELEDLRRQVDTAREELEHLRTQSARHRQLVEEWEKVVSRREEIAQAFARLAELRKRDEELGRLLEPHARLQERGKPLMQRGDSLPSLESGLREAQTSLEAVQKEEAALQAQRSELQDIEVGRQTLQSENERLKFEMNDLRSKVDMLGQGDVRCPLCGTELGEGGREHIASEYEAQGKLLAEQHRQNSAAMGDLEPKHRKLAAAVETGELALVEKRRHLLGRVGTLSQQLEEARKAPQELEALQQELDRLGYDPAAHREVKEVLLKLAAVEEDHRLLQQAVAGLPQERESLVRVTALAQRREETIHQGEERMGAISQEVSGLPDLAEKLDGVEERRRALEGRLQELVARHGFLEARLQEYRETEARKAEGQAAVKALTQEREVFEQLATAFGRTGVQALLVEAAIPELETEANRLLGRMTENTMHLKLETQRESRRGEQLETLEIKVADALGTRSYETFSGGEAFRINLALRIALSKLLAHRAGAPLPTLFIDEGFGTQDAMGRERILDVIQSIADDFERILVITHMDEVKDAFPVRIEVQKTPAGSTFALT